MAFTIEEFKANFSGGARANKFLIEVPFLPDKFNKFLVQSSSIPATDISEVPVKYMGATAKFAGERSVGDWNVTALLDNDYAGMNELEQWQNLMRQPNSGLGATNHTSYKKEAYVQHLNQDGSVIAEYKLEGLFPSSIGEVAFSHETEGIATVAVTFKYDVRKKVS